MLGVAKSLPAAAAALALASGLAKAEIVIGTAGPLTGLYAVFGEQLKRGAEQAVKDLNAKGGVLGEQLSLRIGDDACDPRQAVAVANQMGNAGVVFIAGHFCSGSSIPASQVYNEEGVLQISPASTNPQLTEQGFDNVFRVCGRDDQQGIVAANYVVDNNVGSKVAVLHDETAYGNGLADAFKKQLNARGVQEIMYEAITAGDRDFTALIARMQQADIDLIYLGGYHTEAGLIVRQARERGLEARLVSGDALITTEYWAITGESGQGTLMTFGPDPRKNAAAQLVVQDFKDQGYDPEGYTLYTYAAIQVWAQAVEQAGSTDLDAVIEALHGNQFETVLGTTSFDDKGDAIGPNYVMYEWRDGEIEELTPTQRVRIEARAFVPGPFVWSRLGPCDGGVVHRGDRRIDGAGQAVFTPRPRRFLMRQVVDVLATRSDDGVTLEAVPKRPKVKPTLEYALDALADSRLNSRDNDAVRNDCHLLNRRTSASASDIEVETESFADDEIVIHIRGGAGNPLLPEAFPPVDWDLEVTLDFSVEEPGFHVRGLHDGFPAFEVYVNDELAYGFDPGAPGCELNVETLDGQRSLARYCARQVNKLGGALDVRVRPRQGPIALSG
jgi:branched-chain amino acid transport system substrate-binding protein